MILCQASVCNIQAACYILPLLETLIEIFFCLYRYGLNSRQFYNGKDRTLKYLKINPSRGFRVRAETKCGGGGRTRQKQ